MINNRFYSAITTCIYEIKVSIRFARELVTKSEQCHIFLQLHYSVAFVTSRLWKLVRSLRKALANKLEGRFDSDMHPYFWKSGLR